MQMEGIYEEYHHMVYGYLVGLTGGDRELSEELTQETFYRAVKNIHKFRGDAMISTWLCQIAKYAFYQYIDKKKRHGEISLDSASELYEQKRFEETLVEQEGKVEIFKMVQQLPEQMKDVMMLRLSGELSFREIGEILGKSENWARVTYYRAKQMVGKELRKHGS